MYTKYYVYNKNHKQKLYDTSNTFVQNYSEITYYDGYHTNKYKKNNFLNTVAHGVIGIDD